MDSSAARQTLLLDLPDAPDHRRRARASRPVHISGYAREADDFYPTPAWVTECLLNHIDFRGPIWEPCCGNGAIAQVAAARGHQVVATDLEDYGFGQPGIDFTCQTFPADCKSLLTNPPYGDGSARRTGPAAGRFLRRLVRHALDLTIKADGQMALLVRLQWTAGRKAAELITTGPLDTVLVITKRITWFDCGQDTNQSQHHHCWLFFDCRRDPARPPRILFGQ